MNFIIIVLKWREREREMRSAGERVVGRAGGRRWEVVESAWNGSESIIIQIMLAMGLL